MSMALVCLGCILLLVNHLNVELLVWVRVLGCLYTNTLRIVRMYAASRVDM